MGRVLVDVAKWGIVKERHLGKALEEMLALMGNGYTEAVKWCQGSGAWSDMLTRLFDAKVVAGLMECRA